MNKINKYILEATYFVNHNCTVRKAAQDLHIVKSTLYNHLKFLIKHVQSPLSIEVEKLLLQNKEERSLRGGNATKLKWEAIKNERKTIK